MLVHRKESTKLEKPARFNLGGLLKRKISWRRSIDASIGLTSETPGLLGISQNEQNQQTNGTQPHPILEQSLKRQQRQLRQQRNEDYARQNQQLARQNDIIAKQQNHNQHPWDNNQTEFGIHHIHKPGNLRTHTGSLGLMNYPESIIEEQFAGYKLEAKNDTTEKQASYVVDCHELPSLAPQYLLMAPNGHYTHLSPVHDSAVTECISLQNSEMTHNDEEIDPLCRCDDLNLPQASYPEELPSFDLKNEESIAEYKAGGYCPIKIGDQFCSEVCRYKVLRKLGWGHFSTVWLALSLKNEYVALKVVKSGKNYSEAAVDEIKILKYLQSDQDASSAGLELCTEKFVALLDTFDITTAHGVHVAMVFELMGENILHLIYKRKLERVSSEALKKPLPPAVVPMEMVKLIILQLLRSVDHMHRKGVVHTDIKPENVLMTYEGSIPEAVRAAKPTQTFRILPLKPLAFSIDDIESCPLRVRVADFGNATYSNDHVSDHIQTRQYRAPEILLKHNSWGASADVWLIGCLIFELITGDFLFDPHDGSTFTKDEDHMAQIIELLGEFPSVDYLSQCQKASEFFDSPRSLRNIRSLKFWGLEDVFVEKYKFAKDDVDVLLVSDLIRKCLKYDLNERYDCASLINHPWFSLNPTYDAAALDALPNRNYEIPGFTCEE